MQQPEGFQDTEYVNLKSLYGLKQSPVSWNIRFKDVRYNFGLFENTENPCLFYSTIKDNKRIVGLYVDDGLIGRTKEDDVNEFLCRKMEFELTVESVGYFLNVMIQRDEYGSVFIYQKCMLMEYLTEFIWLTRIPCPL